MRRKKVEPDAWKQYDDLVAEYTGEWVTRQDIKVISHGWDRGIELLIGHRREGGTMLWHSTGRRNVRTMNELANALLHACNRVERDNPEWAAGLTPVEFDDADADGHGLKRIATFSVEHDAGF